MSLNSLDSRLNLVAGDSLYGAGVAHAAIAGLDKVTHSFPELFRTLDEVRAVWKWKPVEKLVFLAAVDRSSDRQGGLLQKATESGAIVDSVDYRDYYPSPSPGGATQVPTKLQEAGEAQGAGEIHTRPVPSLGPRLSFLLGGVAAGMGRGGGTRVAELLLVAHHFELKDSLLELIDRGAKVGIAYYRSLMEPRWERFGLFGAKSAIKFYDLGPHLEELTTLGQRRRPITDLSRSAASQLF